MYYAPFTMFTADDEFHFEHIGTAAQRWADEEDAHVFDANGAEVLPEDLEAVLCW